MAKKHNPRSTVIGLQDEAPLVRGIARALRIRPQLVAARKYRSGEWTIVTPTAVAPRVFVVGNVWEDPASIFCLMLLLNAVREAGAKDVTLVSPWIAYGRQDRPAHPGDTAAGQMVAKMLLATGVDRIVTLDAHSLRFVSFFHRRLVNLLSTEAAAAFARAHKITAVAAPDHGAAERAKRLASALRVPFIQIEKKRLGPGRVISRLASGDPCGMRVLLVDDMVDTGGTLFNAAQVLHEVGATSVSAYVSHAVDLGRLKKAAKKYGLASFGAAFDHRTRKPSVPFSFFVPTRRT